MMILTLGSTPVYGYGAAIALAALLSLLLAHSCASNAGLKAGTTSWFALFAIPLGFICARIGFVFSAWDNWLGSDISWFFEFLLDIKNGGFLLYGTLIGCLLAVKLTSKFTRQSSGAIADALSAPAALMIALSRLAEGLAGEGYGWEISQWFNGEEDVIRSLFTLEDVSPWTRFPLAVQNYYGEWHWAVFLLEALVAFALCLYLLQAKTGRDGGKTVLFLMLYAASQVLCESLRQDSVLRWGFIRASQIYSAIILVVLLVYMGVKLGKAVCRSRMYVCSWIGLVACAGIVLATEFMEEKKIVALEMVPNDVCYFLQGLAVLGMIFSLRPVWKKLYLD